MRFERFQIGKTSRPITNARLKAAERALKRQANKFPLFADQIRAEQPTAQERLEQFTQSETDWRKRMRDFNAQQWREGRRLLRSLPAEQHLGLIQKWNQKPCPADAGYFLDFLHCSIPGEREKAHQALLQKAKERVRRKLGKRR